MRICGLAFFVENELPQGNREKVDMKRAAFLLPGKCIIALCVFAVLLLTPGCGSSGMELEVPHATTPAPTATPPAATPTPVPVPTPAPTPAITNADNAPPGHIPDCHCWAIEFDLTVTDTPTHAAYRWVAPTVFDRVGPVTGGYMWVNYCCRFGIINQAGEFVIPLMYEGFVSPEFNMMYDVYFPTMHASGEYADMASGFIAARLGGMWGVIDIANRVAVPFIYAEIEVHHNYGVATVSDGERWAEDRTTTGLVELATGRKIVPLGRYHTIYAVSDGYAVAFTTTNPRSTIPRLEGLICITTGREVIPLIHDSVWGVPGKSTYQPSFLVYGHLPFQPFREGNYSGVRDADGNIVLPAIYERVDLHNLPIGLALVTQRSPDHPNAPLGGIVDLHTGEVILPMQFYLLRAIGEDRAIALSPDSLNIEHGESTPATWILIDITSGQEIGEITYAFETGHVSDFNGGFAIISVGNAWGDTWRNGLIDNMGREVIPPVNAGIRHFTDYLLVVDDKDERALALRGRILCKETWEEILPWHDYVGRAQEGLAVINTGGQWIQWAEWIDQIVGGHWGIIDDTGQVIIPAVLDFTRVALAQGNANIAAVERDGKWGVIAIG